MPPEETLREQFQNHLQNYYDWEANAQEEFVSSFMPNLDEEEDED